MDELSAGRVLGDFVVGEKLGEGGFGAVYEAEQRLLGRSAVIKVLHGRLREDNTQRFLREARLASRLDHPFAAHIYAFGAEPDGLLWIAMERVRGTSLDALLKANGPLPLHRFVPFFEKLCEVVQTAHNQGITHRDLKPANVMVLSRAGKLLPKLLDLGIAKARGEVQADLPMAFPGQAQLDSDGHKTVSLPTMALEQGASMTASPGSVLDRAVSLDLTQGAVVMGSPHYMAPEQWVNPAAADARTDVYALGVLAFQCLTGRTPFDGKTARAVATAHAKKPFPALPEEFPADLAEVLAKAGAKRPGDRFTSAMDFALAVRAASKLTEEEAAVPQLPEDLREALISDAPQPIAEAIALLEAARRPVRAAAIALDVLRVTTRYLGVIALAARARFGPGAASDAPVVFALLERLHANTLTDQGWWNLLRALVLPFRDRREAHPVPELVAMVTHEESESHASLVELWQKLEAAGASEAKAVTTLPALLEELSAFLKRLFFLQEYRLRLRRGNVAEQWMGLRRNVRPVNEIGEESAADGEFFLESPDGATVLTLAPFLQPIAPTPGAALEPFFLDGTGRHGGRLVALPIGFERHDETLWPWFSEHVVPVATESHGDAEQEAAPFLGLSSFTSSQAENFFGREKEAEAFANRLRVQVLLGVVGPSGAGKSSFIQAGVLPLLAGWHSTTVRPGPSPFATLIAKLAQDKILPANLSVADARANVMARPALLGEWLRSAAHGLGYSLMLVVDQFEELLTLCTDPEERQLFAQALVEAVTSLEHKVRVVLAFRDDFLIRLQQLPAFRERLGEGLQLLGTPASEDLLRILTKPIDRMQYAFEDEDLPKQMVKEVEALPGALALLSFTASKLWELRDRQLKRLTRRAYAALGGVGGALAHHAESTLSATPEKERPLVREAFRHLVTAEGTRAVLSRQELNQLLGGPAQAGPVLERLIVARLLVTSDTGLAEDRVEVIHEALLSSWPRLVQWQRDDAESLRIRDALRAAARQWAERGKPRGLLWRKEPLLEYRVWRGRYTGAVTELEAAFAAASIRDETRGRNVRRGLLITSFVILLAVLAVVARAQRQAQERLAELRLEQGRLASLDGKPLEALVYLDAAYRQGIRGSEIDYLVARAKPAVAATELTLLAHEGLVNALALSPDERLMVSGGADGKAVLWNVADGKRVAVMTGHTQSIMAVAFTPDGKTIATGSWDGTIRLWDATDGTDLGALEGVRALIFDFRISPDGKWIIGAHNERFVSIWDLRSRKRVQQLDSPTVITEVRFSPDGTAAIGWVGHFLFGSGEPGDIPVWEVGRWTRKLLKGHTQPVRSLIFSPDGRTLVTGSEDTTIRVWSFKDQKVRQVLTGHSDAVLTLAMSQDGRSLVSGSADATGRIWDLEKGKLRASLAGHTGPVQFVAFAPDGTRALSVSDDRSARLWDASNGSFLWLYAGHVEPPVGLVMTRDGQSAFTIGSEGFIKKWNLKQRRFDRFPVEGGLLHFDLSPDGKRMLFARTDTRVVEEWDVASRRRVFSRSVPIPIEVISWSATADLLATTDGREVHLWKLPAVEEMWTLPSLSPGATAGTLAALSPDGRRLAVAHTASPVVDLWDVTTRRKIATTTRSEPISALLFSSNASGLIVGTKKGNLSSFRAEDGAQQWTAKAARETAFVSLAASADGRFVAGGSIDRSITVWDAANHKELANIRGRMGGPLGLAFSPDGKLLVSVGYSPYFSVWETKEWKRIDDTPTSSPLFEALLDKSGRLYSGQYAGELTTWDLGASKIDDAELHRFVRCRVPYRLSGQQIVANLKPDADCAADGAR